MKKTWHFVLLVLAIVGIWALYHAYTAHGGLQSVMPSGLGTK